MSLDSCCHAFSIFIIGCYRLFLVYLCYFFFQAEDGIRDWSVTGVQTCALPICNWVSCRSLTLRLLSFSDGRPWMTTYPVTQCRLRFSCRLSADALPTRLRMPWQV